MRPQEDIDAAANDERDLDRIAKKGGAASDWALAVRTARQACADAGLDLTFDDQGVASLSQFQLHKSVRHTREDASATLMLQLMLMRRLDRNRNFMIVIIVLLLYIASSLG